MPLVTERSRATPSLRSSDGSGPIQEGLPELVEPVERHTAFWREGLRATAAGSCVRNNDRRVTTLRPAAVLARSRGHRRRSVRCAARRSRVRSVALGWAVTSSGGASLATRSGPRACWRWRSAAIVSVSTVVLPDPGGPSMKSGRLPASANRSRTARSRSLRSSRVGSSWADGPRRRWPTSEGAGARQLAPPGRLGDLRGMRPRRLGRWRTRTVGRVACSRAHPSGSAIECGDALRR